MREHTFHDIKLVIDEVHDLFDNWVQACDEESTMERYGLLIMKLAVHEWIANLVQHASFVARPASIRLIISERETGLHCVVEDNSQGFDFESQIEKQTQLLSQPEPSERGRGLLMMLACTEDLVYESNGDGSRRLAFVVRPPVDPESMPSFFPLSGRSLDQK